MDTAYTYVFTYLALMFQFKGYQESCISADVPATYTWPLGEGINQYEISTTSWDGNSNNVITYKSGPSYLNYNALELNGNNKAFIEVPVLYSNGIVNDYAISLYLFVVGDGVFLHYKSDDYADTAPSGSLLKSVKMAVLGGKIQTTIGDGLTETVASTSISIAYNQWNRVVFQRERSQNKITYHLESSGSINDQEAVFSQWIENAPTSYPGTLRFGGSLDGDSFVTGRVTCAQFIPCKDVKWDGEYEKTCLTANWPDLASTTTTTTTPTTSSTTNSTSTATSTRPSPTTPATTTLPTASSTLLARCSPPRQISLNCIRYRVAHLNATFSSGILGAFAVDAPLACSSKCSAHGACQSFAFKFRNCMLGSSSPVTVYDAGSIVYELA